ncbi:MAG: hypothetical protein LBU22_00140 [Dysgonamonadaceae bacterium]|jgi:uncharacterized membrane protein|nr:hypothetical protein [Dysgonamonadaceae bacterium]
MRFFSVLSVLFVLSGFWPIQAQNSRIVANPMDLSYRFQFQDPGYREAADPVCEYFKGKYYLFASKSGGYWSSPDLVKWTYIPCLRRRLFQSRQQILLYY